jgi:hypothetical protein
MSDQLQKLSLASTFPASNLEARCLMAVMENSLVNGDNKKEVFQFIKQHFSDMFLDDLLQNRGLYHVCYRSAQRYDILEIVKTFATENAAVAWIMERGEDVVLCQQAIHNIPIVMTILYTDNSGMEDPITDMNEVPFMCYPTFVFDQKAHDIVMDEHIESIESVVIAHDGDMGEIYELIPYWVNTIHEGKVTRGCTRNHFDLVMQSLPSDIQTEAQKHYLNEFEEFNTNPDAFVRRKRTGDFYGHNNNVTAFVNW